MASPSSKKLRIVCVSDTHNKAPGEGFTLPKGDILIHAGDLTNQGTYRELEKAATWLEKAAFARKIVVVGVCRRSRGQKLVTYVWSGNHDVGLDDSLAGMTDKDKQECCNLLRNSKGITFLEHSCVDIALPGTEAAIKVFGSPCSPARSEDRWAFQYPDSAASALWSDIPLDTAILITHTPPSGHVDKSAYWSAGGCPALFATLTRVRPALHICGHCHEGRGAVVIRWSGDAQQPGSIESVRTWRDPGSGKKLSLLDLTGSKREEHGGLGVLELGRETAVVNASIVARSHGSAKVFNKPIVVDVAVAVLGGRGFVPGETGVDGGE